MKKIIGVACGIYIVFYFILFMTLIIQNENELPHIIIIFHLVAMICFGYILFAFVFPSMIFRNRKGVSEKYISIYDGNKPTYKKRCSGRIGILHFKNILKVELYIKGLVLKIPFINAIGITNEEIKCLCDSRNTLRKCIEIHHTSSFITSPIILYIDRSERIIQELKSRVK